mgnify:CR=1 FL=1
MSEEAPSIDDQIAEALEEAEKPVETEVVSEEVEEEAPEEAQEAPAEEEPEEEELPLLEPQNHWHADDKAFFSTLSREQQDAYVAHEARQKHRYDEKAAQANQAAAAVKDFQALVSPAMEEWSRRAISPSQGITQLIQLQQDLIKDPGAALMRLAGEHRVDLGKLHEEQPYIDPQTRQVQSQMREQEERIAQMQREREQESRRQQELAGERFKADYFAFAGAQNEDGTKKYPYAEDKTVLQFMTEAVQTRQAFDIPGAYEWAVSQLSSHPMMQQKVTESKESTRAKVQKAKAASKTVKGDPATDKPTDIDTAIMRDLEAAGWQ